MSYFDNIPEQVTTALIEQDFEELESLREADHSEYHSDLIGLYQSSEMWSLRDGIVFLLQDRRGDSRLKPIMESALNSPNFQTRAIALVWLHNDLSVWDRLITDYAVDEAKVNKLSEEFLAQNA